MAENNNDNRLPQSAEEVPIVNLGGTVLNLPRTPIVPMSSGIGGVPGKSLSPDEIFLRGVAESGAGGRGIIPLTSFYTEGSRYAKTRPFTDFEEMAANNQSTGERWANGLTKMVGTAATTFASGTLGLVYGIGSSIANQRLADVIDNDVTRTMDNINKSMEDYLPNYYSRAENDAAWYSGRNILSANFWADKVFKNLGFSLGTIAGGAVWTKAFKMMGATNALVKAGYGMETAEAVEQAMINAPKAQKFAAFENALNSISQKYIKAPIAAGLKDSDRILTSVMGTFGEASLEGLHNMNDFRKKAIDAYIQENGYSPTGDDLEEINEFADKVGLTTFAANTMLLTATNYVQLPKILGSSKTVDKVAINQIRQKGISEGFEQVLPKTFFGRRINDVKGLSGYLFAKSEAFEEGAQYSIQTGIEDYFNRAYQNKDEAKSFLETVAGAMGNVFTYGVDRTLTDKEGMESILIGGISGGIQQAVGRYRERGLFGGGGQRGANTQKALAALNKTNINNVLTDQGNFIARAIGSQQLRQQAIASDDTLSEKDYEHDFVMSYLMPRVKYGKVDAVNEELSYYENQAMSKEGFEQLQTAKIANENETREQFLSRISNLREIAKSVNELYKVLNTRYSSFLDAEGNKIYTDEVLDKMVYASSKIRDYDKRIPSLVNDLSPTGVFNGLDIISDLANGRSDLYNEAVAKIKALEDTNNPNSVSKDVVDDYLKRLEDLGEVGLRRKKFLDEYNDLVTNPNKYKTAEAAEKKIDEQKIPTEEPKKIVLKTNRGDRELIVGNEYYLGRTVRKATTGEAFFEAPVFTILGDNGDGTVKVKTATGTRDVKKSEFSNYLVGSVEKAKTDKKASFFLQNWNTIYKHKGLKDRNGKPREGRLEYSEEDRVLLFKYINDYGKERTVEVRGEQFVPQQGYTSPMIESVRKLTPAQQQAFDDFVNEKDDIRQNIQRRKQLVVDLVNNSKERLDEVNNELDKAKKSLDEVEEALKNAMFTKKGLPRKSLNGYKKTIDQLSKQKEAIEKTISTLQEEKDELESQLPYMESLLQYAETMPEDYKEAIEDLKDDINSINEMVDNTNDAIKTGESLLSKVNNALKDAISLIDDFVKRLKEENPNIPLFIDEFRSSIERFLGEEGAKNFIAEKQGYTQQVLELQDQISDFSEELQIPDMTKKVQDLESQLSELRDGLEDLIRQSAAKQAILDVFESQVAKFEQEIAEEKKLEQDDKFAQKIMGTADISQRTLEGTTPYEEDSKKTNQDVVRGSVASQKLPGYVASQVFGNNINNFPNREKIKALVVTRKNQSTILPGLIEHLGQTKLSEAEMDGTIAIVMVEEQEDGSRKLVGKDGKVLENPTLENTIYQVMPSEQLRWSEEYGGKSMFREGTPKEVEDSLRQQYKAWRDETLENPPTKTFSIETSFGNPERVAQKDENGVVMTDKNGKPLEDKNAVVSVSEAGLISETDLENKRLLRIPTTNDSESRGTTSFKNAIGRVFLTLKNGLVKLENRRFTEKEATTIYEAIARLSKIMFDEGDVKSEEAQRLLRWLKSVVYWGTPKDAQGKPKASGHNSIFFDSVEAVDESGNKRKSLRLFFSNKDGSIPFTPSYIRDNKSGVVSLIQKLYNNVNATMVNGGKKNEWNEPYEEILEVKPDGEIVSRQWENYQTFLLSSKNPNGSPRDNEELPLFTNIRPKMNEEDANRQGIYFVLTDLQYKEPVPEKKPPAQVKRITPGATTAPAPEPTQKGPIPEAKEGEIDLSGRKINTYTSPSGMKIKWVYDPSKTGTDAIVVLKGGNLDEVLESLTKAMGSEEKAKTNIKNIILKSIPVGALDEEETFVIGEEDAEDYSDAETYTEPEPDTKASEEEGYTPDAEDSEIEDQMREEDDEDFIVLRQVIDEDVTQRENWTKIEAWLKAKFPNVPVYRVKNILQGTNGLQAWGMVKNGAIYVFENAEVGTLYHEVFEGVWKMMSTPKEKRSVIKEFTSRKGSFVDRPTGQVIAYKDATNSQVKEQLAEEFRDYVMYGKIPPKPVDGRPFILKLFSDLVNMIKNFFADTPGARNNTERLFTKIGRGYYKSYIPYETNLSFAKRGIIDIEDATIDADSELRLKLPGENVHDIMQHMTYLTLRDIVSNNESLFNVEGKPKSELYRMLRYEIGKAILKKARAARKLRNAGKYAKEDADPIIQKGIAQWKTTMKSWDDIVKKHEEYLRSYNIEFDENDEVNLTADENTGRGEFESSDKIDHFRKTNSAVKLLLSTLPIMEDGKPQYSSINGVKLLPLSQVYMSLMNNLHTSRNLDEMIERIRQMAIQDENYRLLYSRLTGTDYSTDTVDFSEMMNTHDLQLLIAMWTTFKKQSPDARTVFVFETGDVEMGESNLSNAGRQVKSEYENALISTIRKKNPYFEYSEKEKVFVGKPSGIKEVKLTGDETVIYAKMVEFLKSLGINFKESEIRNLSIDKKTTFKDAVTGIRDSIKSADRIATVSGKVLDIEGRLLQLGLIRASIDNPEFDSTFFNVKGERTQTFMGTNALSDFFDAISQIKNLNELAGTQYEYLLTDEFAEGSVILSRMFNMTDGSRKDTPAFMKAGYADGTVNLRNGKRKQSSKLTYKERLIQEINMNLNGYYSNLVPGDASLEHTAYMGNAISEQSLLSGFDNVFKIFGGYLISEVKLARNDSRTIVQDKNDTRKTTDLRFFKGILGEELHDKIVKDKTTPIEEIYGTKEKPGKYKKQVDAAVEAFIKRDAQKTRAELTEYGIIKLGETDGEFITENIAFSNASGMTEADLNRKLNALSTNYIINNIELHKLIYSDPYQYADELKRIKNFLSPRQAVLYGSPKMNEAMDIVYNRGYGKKDVARTNFNRDYFRTISYNDILGEHALPGYEEAMYSEADGAGIINFKSYRNFRIRVGRWSAAEEAQYKYDMAWMKNDRGLSLSKFEEEILAEGNPNVRSAYTTEKPIVSGNKADGNNFNDVVLDKYALYPLSYRIIKQINPDSNALKLYLKMEKEDIDYVVFDSARKVGAKNSLPLYKDGVLNPDPYTNDSIINIPFAIMSTQAEIPSKEDELVTRGSQITKLVTLNFMEAGIPADFEEGKDFNERYAKWITLSEKEKEKSEIYREIKNNQRLLEAMIDNGYQSLLNRMGINEIVKNNEVVGYEVKDFSKAAQTLREEILKRETNDNIIDALDDFISGKAVLEATPAYQQVRNILYSIADKEMISPKMSGGLKVQIPSTLLENVRATPKVIETKKGPKTVYTSEELSFYKDENGKRVCEIMVGRWFKSDLTDEQLMEYFNSPEGRRILSGVSYRIPTQKENSIDAFVVKRLLPAEFGDNVIVPAALVQKQGSDFDIDKLSIYFKNLFVGRDGKPKLIKFFNIDTNNEDALRDFYEENLLERYKKFKQLEKQVASEQSAGDLMSKIFADEEGEVEEEESAINKLKDKYIPDVNEFILQNKGKDVFELNKEWNRYSFKKVLENEYIESLERLVTHPKNFSQLIKPNSAQQLKDLANEITKLRGFEGFDYSSTKNMLSRTFMSRLRHAFVTGKYAIGIAAVNQTNHSLNQRQPIYIDLDSKLDVISDVDKMWLGDGKINFADYNSMLIKGKRVPVLSMAKNKAGEFISDLIGQFIDGYVDISKGPWIMELGGSPNVASTWLFLIKVGVPMNTVAYFMNQPIVRDYLNMVENAGYSWLFIDDFVKLTLDKYKSEYTSSGKIPSEAQLKKMIGNKNNLNKQQLAQQRLILMEFLKYAKMANHLFLLTQGTNFDTSTFNDPFLVFKKNESFKRAQNTIFSSIDEDGNTIPAVNSILENSFIGKLAYRINTMRDAYAEFLHSDKGRVRNVLENVLLPYVETSDREFVKLARKAVSDLFDWAIQTDPTRGLNRTIADILLKDGGTAEELAELFKSIRNNKKHPLRNNHIIKNMVHEINGEVNNMKLKNRDNKVYDQNQVIYGFAELKNYLNSIDQMPLYKRLVAMSILQSGLSTSPISFTQLLPYEDFKGEYNQILSKLETISNLEDFHELGVFQRNNWNDDDVVPYSRARWIEINDANSPSGKRLVYNPAMEFLPKSVKKAVFEGNIPPVVTMSTLSSEAQSDYIVFTWEKGEELLSDEELKLPYRKRRKLIKSKKLDMKKRGDFSYIQKGLFKIVKESDEPNADRFIHTYKNKAGEVREYHVYKMMNAWGNSFSANEFYSIARPSVIENRFLKTTEISDSPVINAFLEQETKKPKTTPRFGTPRSSTPAGTISGKTIKLKDGVTYGFGAVNSKMLETMGYTPEEISQILKSIC